jgi:hypothetical protein
VTERVSFFIDASLAAFSPDGASINHPSSTPSQPQLQGTTCVPGVNQQPEGGIDLLALFFVFVHSRRLFWFFLQLWLLSWFP